MSTGFVGAALMQYNYATMLLARQRDGDAARAGDFIARALATAQTHDLTALQSKLAVVLNN